MTQYTATGNTYKARNILRECGFIWDRARKVWTGPAESVAEFRRTTTPTYSRRRSHDADGVDFEEVVG